MNASIGLSAAFYVNYVPLKRIRIIGSPGYILGLVEVWLFSRYCYVSDNGKNTHRVSTHYALFGRSLVFLCFISCLLFKDNFSGF
jgi:hypothetical protein